MGDLGMPVGQLEGSLPDCLKIAKFGDRMACWFDNSCRLHPHKANVPRYGVAVGLIDKWDDEPLGFPLPCLLSFEAEMREFTDDDKEAERLWLKAQEVLRNPEEQSE